ncbi:MAG: ExbD/TolR family protein [Spirulinaceae cyanobacterium]
MRLRHRQESGIPDVNLVPMMDVLMSVLTFFVIATITMTGQNITGVELPTSADGQGTQATMDETETLIVGLTQEQTLSIDDQAISQAEMMRQLEDFLQAHPDGMIILSAHRSLDYEQIEDLLKTMGSVGGDRVSLAIQKN